MKLPFMSQLSDTWSGLQQRERNIILAGLGLVLVVALYLSFADLMATRGDLNQKKEELNAEILWGKEQAEILSGLDNSCARHAPYTVTGRGLITTLGAENRLTVGSLTGSRSQGYRLVVTASNGDDILRFAHSAACAGFYLTELTINVVESNNVASFEGSLNLSEEVQGKRLDQLSSNTSLYWRWFANASMDNSVIEEVKDEELDEANIDGDLLGVIVTSQFSAATIKLRGQKEKVYHVGDDIGRGVVIKEISPDRVVVEERGRRLQIPLNKFEALLQASTSKADATGIQRLNEAEGLSIPDMFSAEVVPAGEFGTGLKLDGLSEELKTLANIQSGDVIVQVGTSAVEDLMADPTQWVNYSAESALPVTVIRDGKEVTVYINAFSLSAKILPTLTSELMP